MSIVIKTSFDNEKTSQKLREKQNIENDYQTNEKSNVNLPKNIGIKSNNLKGLGINESNLSCNFKSQEISTMQETKKTCIENKSSIDLQTEKKYENSNKCKLEEKSNVLNSDNLYSSSCTSNASKTIRKKIKNNSISNSCEIKTSLQNNEKSFYEDIDYIRSPSRVENME